MPSKGKPPAFQFYPGDWLSSGNVRLMNSQERGIYIQLLAHDWLGHGLPLDIESLAKLADESLEVFEKSWRKLSKCFYQKDGKYHNRRLQIERRKQRERSAKMRENAEKLWRSPSKQKHTQKNALHLQSSSISSLKDTPLTPLGITIPDDLKQNEPEILKWLAYKQERREMYKPTGLSALWGVLRRMPADQRARAIENSMGSGYKGIFQLKGGQDNGTFKNSNSRKPAIDPGNFVPTKQPVT